MGLSTPSLNVRAFARRSRTCLRCMPSPKRARLVGSPRFSPRWPRIPRNASLKRRARSLLLTSAIFFPACAPLPPRLPRRCRSASRTAFARWRPVVLIVRKSSSTPPSLALRSRPRRRKTPRGPACKPRATYIDPPRAAIWKRRARASLSATAIAVSPTMPPLWRASVGSRASRQRLSRRKRAATCKIASSATSAARSPRAIARVCASCVRPSASVVRWCASWTRRARFAAKRPRSAARATPSPTTCMPWRGCACPR